MHRTFIESRIGDVAVEVALCAAADVKRICIRERQRPSGWGNRRCGVLSVNVEFETRAVAHGGDMGPIAADIAFVADDLTALKGVHASQRLPGIDVDRAADTGTRGGKQSSLK